MDGPKRCGQLGFVQQLRVKATAHDYASSGTVLILFKESGCCPIRCPEIIHRSFATRAYPRNPRGGNARDSLDPDQPQFRVPRRVIKGGSFLCADSYCMRYRPAARRPQMIDTGMSNIGFRCVVRNADAAQRSPR